MSQESKGGITFETVVATFSGLLALCVVMIFVTTSNFEPGRAQPPVHTSR